MSRLLLILSFSLFCWSSFLAAAVPESSPEVKESITKEPKPFYLDRKRGFYWNEKEDIEKEKSKESKPEQNTEANPIPSLKNYTYDQLWNMHPDDFQDLSNKILKKAVQYPTESNVYDYNFLQDIARRKAAAFASSFSLVTQKYPEFGVQDVFPTSQPGLIAKRDTESAMFDQAIKNGREEFALVLVTRKGCHFCETEKGILANFESRYGWLIREMEVTQDAAHAAFAESNDITTFPTLLVVYKNTGQHMPVVTGATSLEETKMKLYFAMRYLKGDTNAERFQMYEYQQGTGMDPMRKPRSFDKSRGVNSDVQK